MCSLTIECVLVGGTACRGDAPAVLRLEKMLSHYRMCSLTIECVLVGGTACRGDAPAVLRLLLFTSGHVLVPLLLLPPYPRQVFS